MAADIILENRKVKVTGGSLETTKIDGEVVSIKKLRVNNDNNKLFTIIDGSKGQIRVTNQDGGGSIMTINGNREKAVQIVGNVAILGTISNIEFSSMKRKIEKLEKELAALKAKK